MEPPPVADVLRWRREQLDKSQGEVARDAGTTQATVSRLEGGRFDVRLSTLVETARALGMDVRLVPREILPAVDDLLGSVRLKTRGTRDERPLYALGDDDDQDDHHAE